MSHTRRSFLTASTAALSSLALPRILCGQQGIDAQYSDDDNLFLIADFEPIREETTLTDLQVKGKLPKELNGFFLRNGPNPQFPPKNNYHLFEGDGMIHGVQLENGNASYRNRYVRTAVWESEHAAGKSLYPSVLDPVDWKHVAQSILAGELPAPNRANTALVWHHGKLLALWEGGLPHEISLPKLGTVGAYDFGKKLSHNFTAHPKIDPTTGELIFFGYQAFAPYLQHSVADRSGRITHTTTIPIQHPAMMHDAAITRNYTVFIDSPAVFDINSGMRGEPFLKWSHDRGSRIGVLPRYGDGSAIKWFDVQTCFVFHVFNAFEVSDEVVLHACRYDKYPAIADFSSQKRVKHLDALLEDAKSVAFTWRLNIKTGEVVEQALDDVSTEFPQVDQNRTGSETRYGYCAAVTDIERCTFHKYDFATGKRETHQLGKDRVVGEGIFVPSESAKSEDDGYLLALSYDRVNEQSELVVLRADDFAAAPIARVVIPRRIPAGFHAAWVPSG